MIISISQPTLFPWIGYFDIIQKSDIFVFLDNVKFEKRSWQMRNRIKFVSKDIEKEIWIRIPTTVKKSETDIKDVLIDNSQKWKNVHMNTFRSNYGNEFQEIEFLKEMYDREWEFLADFNMEFIKNCCKYLNITTKIEQASKLNVDGNKSQLLLNICKKFSASKYLSTIGSKNYLENDKKIFEDENIEIIYHDFKQPNYKQKGNRFYENLSILDLILTEGENSYKFFIN